AAVRAPVAPCSASRTISSPAAMLRSAGRATTCSRPCENGWTICWRLSRTERQLHVIRTSQRFRLEMMPLHVTIAPKKNCLKLILVMAGTSPGMTGRVDRLSGSDAMNIQDNSRYHEVHARSLRDPEGFWGEAAREIDWIEPAKKVFDPAMGLYGRWLDRKSVV